jgi:hypothetical protein
VKRCHRKRLRSQEKSEEVITLFCDADAGERLRVRKFYELTLRDWVVLRSWSCDEGIETEAKRREEKRREERRREEERREEWKMQEERGGGHDILCIEARAISFLEASERRRQSGSKKARVSCLCD